MHRENNNFRSFSYDEELSEPFCLHFRHGSRSERSRHFNRAGSTRRRAERARQRAWGTIEVRTNVRRVQRVSVVSSRLFGLLGNDIRNVSIFITYIKLKINKKTLMLRF